MLIKETKIYRIVQEVNKLTGKTQYFIEKRKAWLWMVTWVRDLGIRGINTPIGAQTLDGANKKLEIIKEQIGEGGNAYFISVVKKDN